MKHFFAFVAFLCPVAFTSAETVLFEPGSQNSNFYLYDGGWVPNETAELFRLGSSGATITGFDVVKMADHGSWSQNPDNYLEVRLQVTFFGGFQTSYTGVGPQFSNPITTAEFDLGPQNLQTDTWYSFVGAPGTPYFELPNPVNVPDDLIGAQFTWLVDQGNGLTFSDRLELCFASSASVVGDNGFVVNGRQFEWIDTYAVDSSTPLAQTQVVTQSIDNLSVRFYGTPVPEPAEILVVLLGIGGMGLRRHRRRSA
jgi:hypothetical protein